MSFITPKELYDWCKIPYTELEDHPNLKIPFQDWKKGDPDWKEGKGKEIIGMLNYLAGNEIYR
jgi:hypothetical protein